MIRARHTMARGHFLNVETPAGFRSCDLANTKDASGGMDRSVQVIVDSSSNGTSDDAAMLTDTTTREIDAAIDAESEVVTAPDGACLCRPSYEYFGCNSPSAPFNPNRSICGISVDEDAAIAACPALNEITCRCDQGRCVRSGFQASGIIPCAGDVNCPPGDCCAVSAGVPYCTPIGEGCCPSREPAGFCQ
jgi:hypothetical protein